VGVFDTAGRRPDRVLEAIMLKLVGASGEMAGMAAQIGGIRADGPYVNMRSPVFSSNQAPTMILTTFAPLLLLPFVAANGVHRMKLKKLPPTASNPSLETAYLAEKYGAVGQSQTPLIGTGGSGRNVRLGRPFKEDDGLFWTQEELKGGHGVPLSSM